MLFTTSNKNKSKRKVRIQKYLPHLVTVIAFVTCQSSLAQEVRQSLDRTFVFGSDVVFDENTQKYVSVGRVAEVDVADRQDNADIIDLKINGTNITTCQLSAFGGLYCLDGAIVRNWPAPSSADGAPASVDAVDCGDWDLGLDQSKGGPCTGMTVDFDGNIWLAGKNKGKTHSLIKLVPLGSESDGAPCTKVVGNYCAHEFASGRPLLVDIAPVDGRLEKGFSLPGHEAPLKAIIGLEERKSAVAFLVETGEVIEFASGKQFWGLSGPEQLTGITLLQIAGVGGAPPSNKVLVATSFGRILAYDTSGSQPPNEAFSFVTSNGYRNGMAQCNFDEPRFALRASRRTEIVYASDSQYCTVLTLKPVPNSVPFKLAVDLQAGPYSTEVTENNQTVLSMVPLGVTVAAGNSINLAGCGDAGCTLVPGAELKSVKLLPDSPSGLTLFQIDGMPDCRYIPDSCLAILGIEENSNAIDALIGKNVIEPMAASDRYNPVKQRLNVSPLMPEEITELFPGGKMPDLWLPHYLRGQAQMQFRFSGFFGRTQEGVSFMDTFEGKYDVLKLAGKEHGCPYTDEDFLKWDVLATVSERFASESRMVDGTRIPLFVATITNSDCGSGKSLDGRWSFKPYNLELTPCTFNPTMHDTWWGGCEERPGDIKHPYADDAVYAKLIHLLMDELLVTVREFACRDTFGENGNIAPLTEGECQQVESRVLNATDKFEKCWSATLQPKQSSGDQNCQAFNSQLEALYADLGSILYDDLGSWRYEGTDAANRIGELRARTVRIRHILETRFLPSLPDGGFSEPPPSP